VHRHAEEQIEGHFDAGLDHAHERHLVDVLLHTLEHTFGMRCGRAACDAPVMKQRDLHEQRRVLIRQLGHRVGVKERVVA
jgi:hypothetical protein